MLRQHPSEPRAGSRQATYEAADVASMRVGLGGVRALPQRPWDRSPRVPRRNDQNARSQPYESSQAIRTLHVRCTVAEPAVPQKARFPRSERFCLGMLGGAGGTRTHTSDPSHLRFSQRARHIGLFPSGCIPLDPAPAAAVQRSLHRSLTPQWRRQSGASFPARPQPPSICEGCGGGAGNAVHENTHGTPKVSDQIRKDNSL